MALIDIGPGAINRVSSQPAGYTNIQKNNPANATGKITLVELYFDTAATGVKVGTFYGSGTSYTNRAFASIGAVPAGWSSHVVNFDVVAGDLFGTYFASGTLECDGNTGGLGVYEKSGDQFGAGAQTYADYANYGMSVYGTGDQAQTLFPSSIIQAIAYGTPTVGISGIVISPQGIAVIISYGTPALRYPQTISPAGLSVPIAYGTPSVTRAGEEGVIYVPGHQQPIGYGTPTILKYVWHLILDGQYNTESPAVNRAYVIGRDIYGNPIYGEAHDTGESALVGERLDFQPDPAIPTTAQAADVAAAVLSKMRLTGKRGVILIPPNCGQELFDVVQITDAGANQQAVKFRVVGLRFEYHPKQARYEHRLVLGAP